MSESDGPVPTIFVNLDQYPIADIRSGAGKAFADECQRIYTETGLCALPDFIRQSSLKPLVQEASKLQHHAYFCKSVHNAYLRDTDSTAPVDDATNQMEKTFVGSVPYDRIDEKTGLRRLYQWDALKDFIGHVLGKKEFYRFADPLGACSINVFDHGGEHGWHFDESEYTVTLMLQEPQQGGAFEYVPCIRGRADEKSIVSETLNGDRKRVVQLPFNAGTLLIFGGRQTLHRVTRVSGDRPRLVPVLCYSESPDAVNSAAVRKLFWGRANP